MKTFSFSNLFTLICFVCFALMLVGNTAEAQDAGLKVITEPSVEDITILDGTPETRQFEVQLVDGSGTGIPGIAIEFNADPAGAATFSSSPVDTDTDGVAQVTVTFTQAGTIRVEGTISTNISNNTAAQLQTLKDQGINITAYAGLRFVVVEEQSPTIITVTETETVTVTETVKVPVLESVEPEPTTVVVLPPIPCVQGSYVSLGQISEVSSKLSSRSVIERVKTVDSTPTSLTDIETHKGLLSAIEPVVLTKLAPGDMFRVPIVILNAKDLSGWNFDIAYNPQILEVIEISEGDFLKQNNTTTFFQQGTVNNTTGKITLITQARLTKSSGVENTNLTPQGSPEWATEIKSRKLTNSIDGANDTGELVSICFKVKEFAEESLGLHNLQLSDSVGNRLNFMTIVHPIVVTHDFSPKDVNRDGVVDSKDLMIIAANLGRAKPMADSRADVNNDGIVNALDLVIVAQHINDTTPAVKVRDKNMLAPSMPTTVLTAATIQGWIDMARVEDDGSAIFDLGIANLEALLVSTIPSQTKLLLNYPNPFNPETWIPYQLAAATEVSISIYSVNGNLIRTLALGHQAAGTYQSKSQAAYWDGRNELGEPVASGVYFYTFTAGEFSATGKMLVRK